MCSRDHKKHLNLRWTKNFHLANFVFPHCEWLIISHRNHKAANIEISDEKSFRCESSKHSFNFTLVLISIEKPLNLTWGRDFPPSFYHAFKWLPSFNFTYFLASFSTVCSAFDSLSLSKGNWKYESLKFVHLTSIKEKAQECSFISCFEGKLDFRVKSCGLSFKIWLDLFALVYCVFLFTSRAITASNFM